MDTNDFLLKEECYQVIGCAMKVHSELGNGFLEAVYQEALMIEFSESRVPFEKEKPLVINYKGSTLNKRYYADFICYDELIIEVKATDGLHTEHTAQVLNYLKATGHHNGLLLNFGTTKLQYKRVIL